MYFNFDSFRAFAIMAYNKVSNINFTLDEVLSIFEYYFSRYEFVFQEPHPYIKMEQIERIIEKMPYIGLEHGNMADIDTEEYRIMIDKHFKTQYCNCDYNINHFFAGNIRMLRFYEAGLY